MHVFWFLATFHDPGYFRSKFQEQGRLTMALFSKFP